MSLLLPNMQEECLLSIHGQDSYVEYYDESLGMNNIGMAVLGSWALSLQF